MKTCPLFIAENLTGVVTEYLYRKLRPFFASKPALM